MEGCWTDERSLGRKEGLGHNSNYFINGVFGWMEGWRKGRMQEIKEGGMGG